MLPGGSFRCRQHLGDGALPDMLYGIDPLELQDLGEKLLILSHRMPGPDAAAALPHPLAGQAMPTPYSFARAIYQGRQKRWSHLDDCGLGEPGWDMLLDLFIARHEGKTVRTTSLCVAAATPTTTGLRYIAMLERRGLVRRVADPEDQRVTNVTLSDQGLRTMDELLRSMLERFTATLYGMPASPPADEG